jgi:Fe2+ or Zn2+ uptake regulation protein
MSDDYRSHLVADPHGPDAIEPPTFFEIGKLIESEGLVGERDTGLTVVIGAVRGGLIALIGIARGGKDQVLNCALEAYPDNTVYEWSNGDDSATAPYYNATEINSHDVHYLGDLARLNETVERIAKAWGEGKDAKRGKTDVFQAEGEEHVEQVLKCPRTVFCTVASDNRNFDLNDFPEVQKRAFMLGVDGTEEQTIKILRRKALEHMGQTERTVKPIRKAQIQNYMGDIPIGAFHGSANNRILNPMAGEMIEQTVLPTAFVEARFDGDRLLEFIETITLVNHSARFTVDTGTGYTMLVAPADVWYGMKILGENMVMSSLNLTDEDQAVLRYLRESSSLPTRKDIQQGLRQAGYAITDTDVKQSLDSMRQRGYVAEQDESPKTYKLSEFASVTQHKIGLDYQKIVDAAKQEIYNTPGIPEDVASAYVRHYCEGEGLLAVDPFSGETINITEDTGLQDAMNEATNDVAEIFDDPFGNAASAFEPPADEDPVPAATDGGQAAPREVGDDDDTQGRLV